VNNRIYAKEIFYNELKDYHQRNDLERYCPNCWGAGLSIVFSVTYDPIDITVYKCDSCCIETDVLLNKSDVRDKKIDGIIKNPN
jgi:hypothetical protein